MNTRSVRFQLGLWYAGLLTAVFVLLGVATIVLLRHYLETIVRDSQFRRARQISEVLTPETIQKGPGAIHEEIEARFAPARNNRFVRVRRADGPVIYESAPPQDGSFDPEKMPAESWPKQVESWEILRAGGAPLLVVRRVVRGSGGIYWLVESGAPLTMAYSVLRDASMVMALTLLVAIGVAVVGGYFLVGRALTVVNHITQSAEQISLHSLSERLPIARTGDEIERLSLALNRMIQRLDEAFQHSKRFVADASHELRTPLTILRGELEALVQREHLEPVAQERLGSLLEEVDRLSGVVEGLLMLSRLDAGEAQGEWVHVDLAALVNSTVEQMGLLAEDKRIELYCQSAGAVLVNGDRARLKQVVVNLLDNAIKYTPPEGRISVRVQALNGQAVLEVADTGIGIPASVVSHVFDRFFRADEARTRDAGGAGLGLAIVQSICWAHAGRAKVESVEGQGSVFRVELPLAPDVALNNLPVEGCAPRGTEFSSVGLLGDQPRPLAGGTKQPGFSVAFTRSQNSQPSKFYGNESL